MNSKKSILDAAQLIPEFPQNVTKRILEEKSRLLRKEQMAFKNNST